ncbi:MAG: alpha/beta fold hydrolase, partial [Clostridia bacterium]|nr:alpha/beta fold hydrolase [Clostridia bacterium]
MALCNEELQYLSANGGDQITAQLWRDDAVTPRGLLQIVHGMNEYMGRYEDFAAFMAASGFIVFGNDHTGHGKSKGAGGYGYFADKDGPGVLVKDVRTLNETVTHRYPQLPCFMLGHSLGSFICRSYITKYGDELAGIIISGTAGPNPLGGIGMVLSRLIIALRGPGYRSTMLIKMAFGNYNKRYGESRTQYDWLTRDTAIVDKYASDERC